MALSGHTPDQDRQKMALKNLPKGIQDVFYTPLYDKYDYDVVLIFRGAPGCGKTTLALKIRDLLETGKESFTIVGRCGTEHWRASDQ